MYLYVSLDSCLFFFFFLRRFAQHEYLVADKGKRANEEDLC